MRLPNAAGVDDDDNRADAAARLISAQRWLALATVDVDGEPQQSYVPFAVAGPAFGIVVSRLAAHTASLVARRPAAIMVVDAAGTAGDAYARARLSVTVSPLPLARGSAGATDVWSALRARHGATAELLESLPDFEAVALVPTGGRLILGFASAHDLEPADLVRALQRASSER